ncbi:antitoxin [Actinacidiphila sp. DG2A-62]|jgi:plasmid stability protein|uniref:FitA-like ribbon-helix-helix domain-containing protein n=1 Tax=Actinacidiphila sp. DG2A-62 TaxID=3108821 RepID=UPI002DB8712B|nr:antitoxin [Actinacidiphila sp. DG2A-62]MEC3996154.1 antitoxin [Actinacidiphila sp. DG2A-62]
MTAITIRDVPDDTVNALKVRAAQAGKSLQAYALELLSREAAKPTLAEMAARLERETRTALSTTDILDAIEDGRERR